VQPFLVEAMKLCEAGDADFDARSAFPANPAMMGPNFDDPEVVTWPLEKWSPPTNFAEKYGPELSEASRCRILLHGQGVQIRLAENKNEIQEVEASSGNKKKFFVRAKFFVLACGGLENARLLLASNQILAAGIGNQEDQVGRYYQSHQFGVCGHAVLREPQKMVYDFERDRQGAYARRRFWMTAYGQQSHKIGNVIGFFFRQSQDVSFHRDPLSSSLYLAKSCLHRLRQGLPGMKRMWSEDRVEMGHHLRVVFREAPQLAPQILDLTKKRFFSKRRLPFVLPSQRNNYFPLYYQAEHAPTRESRLVLTPEERDDLGMPRLLVKVVFSEIDFHTVRSFFRVFGKRIEASGAGKFFYQEEKLEQQFADRKQTFNSNAHHIGTTRMSDSPRTGVVDSDGRVHGISNLYVGGSSIYPTSGHANPTLLAVMLALRLAKKLLNECGR
jgi:choline dehydrogenase-like flavoprotein